jgi:putative transcriptional regulator
MEKETALKAAHRSIERSLKQAINHVSGNTAGAVVYRPRPIDVKALRQKIGMTQLEFAARFGFSAATLRHWERGDRVPHGPARVLLNVIEHNPKAVMAALAA